MTLRPRFSFFSLTAGLICFLAQSAAAQGPVRVLVSNGMKAVVEELQPRCERAIGHALSLEYGSTAGLKQKIDAGAPFDAVILTSEAIGELVKEGKVIAATRADFARCGVGVAVRAGSAKPDISTPAALKRTLREAASITYAGDGASRAYIDKMLEELGLAEEAKPKIVLTQGSGPAMASVAAGQAALVMTLMSELLPVHGIDVVGPFPAELQNFISFGAAASVKASEPKGAEALIAFLLSAESAIVYKTKGMERVGGAPSSPRSVH
jgi:molybdate transport system substrate-binding protein